MIKLKSLLVEHNKLNIDQESMLKNLGFNWNGKEYYKDNTDSLEDGHHVTVANGKLYWNHYDTGQMDSLTEKFNSVEELVQFLQKFWI